MRVLKTLLLILVLAVNVSAQDGGLIEFSLVQWINLDAPPGREYLATDTIRMNRMFQDLSCLF